MSNIKDGRRPAFPAHGPFEPGIANTSYSYPGMTLRDYFAAKALSGLLAFSGDGLTAAKGSPLQLAEASYKFADAMLAERETGK